LDPQARVEVWRMIRELKKSGTTIFLTTQYLEEADELADEIAILSQGKIASQGSPEQLKKSLPHGLVELEFENPESLRQAAAIVGGTLEAESLKLGVSTDGSVRAITELLNTLAAANIRVVEFAQKSPSLDDVFFSAIQKKE
jgi:ABC-2 type transport system ATP-binding protein